MWIENCKLNYSFINILKHFSKNTLFYLICLLISDIELGECLPTRSSTLDVVTDEGLSILRFILCLCM